MYISLFPSRAPLGLFLAHQCYYWLVFLPLLCSTSPFIAVSRIPLQRSVELSTKLSTCTLAPIDSIVSLDVVLPLSCPTDAFQGTTLHPSRFLHWKEAHSNINQSEQQTQNISMVMLMKCLALFPAHRCAASDGEPYSLLTPCPSIQINFFETVVRPNDSEHCMDWFIDGANGIDNPTQSGLCRINLQLNLAYYNVCAGLIAIKQPFLLVEPDLGEYMVGNNIELFTPFSTAVLQVTSKIGTISTSFDRLPWCGSAMDLNRRLPFLRFQPSLNWTNANGGTVIRVTMTVGANVLSNEFTIFPGVLSSLFVFITPGNLSTFNATRFKSLFINVVNGIQITPNILLVSVRPFITDAQIPKIPYFRNSGTSPANLEVILQFLSQASNTFAQLAKNINSLVAKNTTVFPQGNVVVPYNKTAPCGTGRRYPTFACDDGNTVNNDGCSSSCTIESGWMCWGRVLQKSICTNKTTFTPTFTATQTTTPTPLKGQIKPQIPSSSDDKTIPIAVGVAVPLGVLLIAGLVGGFIYKRRRNRVIGEDGDIEAVEKKEFSSPFEMPMSPASTAASDRQQGKKVKKHHRLVVESGGSSGSAPGSATVPKPRR